MHETSLAFQNWGVKPSPVMLMTSREPKAKKNEELMKFSETSKGGDVGTTDL